MEGLVTLEKYYETYSKSGTKDKKSRLNLGKKMDILFDMENELKTLARKELQGIRERVVGILTETIKHGCGASLTRLIFRIYSFLFQNIDRSRLPIFIDTHSEIILSLVAAYSYKISALYLMTKIFQKHWSMMITAPTPEIISAISKFLKTNTQWYAKEGALTGLGRIIKSKANNLSASVADILKIIGREILDRSVEVRFESCKCLKELSNIIDLSIYYELYFNLCLKAFDDNQKNTRMTIVYALAQAVHMHFDKLGKKILPNSTPKRSIKEPPNNLLDLIYSLQSQFTKGANDEMKESVVEVIVLVMKWNKQLVIKTQTSIILQYLLHYLSKSKGDEYENFKQRKLISWLLKEYSCVQNKKNQLGLLDILLSQLEHIKDKLKEGIMKEKSKQTSIWGSTEKIVRGISQTEEQQIIVLLDTTNIIILDDTEDEIEKKYQDVNALTDILLGFMCSPASGAIRMAAGQCIKSLALHSKFFVAQLLSLLLNLTTIAHAELAAIKPSLYFIHTPPQKSISTDEYIIVSNQLLAYGEALACILHLSFHSANGVPLDIANAALSAAINMVSGTYRPISEEDDHNIAKTINSSAQTPIQAQAGWSLLEGLIGLQSTWVATSLQTFFKLWNLAFDQQSSTVNIAQLQNEKYMDTVLCNFQIKKKALSALRAFMLKCQELITPQLNEYISIFLINIIKFIYPFKEDWVTQVFSDQRLTVEFRQFKADVYECLTLMNPVQYKTIFTQLIPKIIETITTPQIAPTIWQKWLSKEDNQLYVRIMGEKQFNSWSLSYKIFEEEALIPLIRTHRVQSDLLSEEWNSSIREINLAIQLFGEIFSSGHFHQKNRRQLTEHLAGHITAILQIKDNKAQFFQNYSKIISIVLALFSIPRAVLLRQSSEIEDPKVYEMLIGILENGNNFSENLIRRICSEGIVLMYKACTILDPDMINQLVGKIEKLNISEDPLVKMTAGYLAANVMRHFETEAIHKLKSKIIQIMQRVLKHTTNVSKIFACHNIFIAFKHTGAKCPEMVDATYPLCYHHFHTDIKKENNVFASICSITDLILKTNQLTKTKAQEKLKRLEIIQRDSLNFLRSNYKLPLFAILNFTKTLTILEKFNNFNEVSERVFNLWEKCEDYDMKGICLEVISTFIFKGYLKTIMEQYPNFEWRILNEINNVIYNIRCYETESIKEALNLGGKNEKEAKTNTKEWERLMNLTYKNDNINISTVTQLQYSNLDIIYHYNLEHLLYLLLGIFKTENLQIVITFMKDFFAYHDVVVEEEEESVVTGVKGESIMGAKESKKVMYIMSKALHGDTKIFMLKSLTKLISNLKDDTIIPHLNSLIAIGFTNISSDNTGLKILGFRLMKGLTKRLKNTSDQSSKLNEEDEADEVHILEQFEAQMNSLIRQNLNKYNAYPILNKVYSLLFYFITIPITRDIPLLEKIFKLLTNPLEDLAIPASTQFFSEKVALESHYKRLKLLCKIFLCSKGIDDYQPISLYKIDKGNTQIENEKHKFLLNEDRTVLQELFNEQCMILFLQHIRGVLEDNWIILSQSNKVIKSYTNFTFIHSGTSCAYSPATCDTTSQCLLTFLSKINLGKYKIDNLEPYLEMILSFYLFYISKSIPQEDKSTSHLSNAIQLKVRMIYCMQQFITNNYKSLGENQHLEVVISISSKIIDLPIYEIQLAVLELISAFVLEISLLPMEKVKTSLTLNLIHKLESAIIKLFMINLTAIRGIDPQHIESTSNWKVAQRAWTLWRSIIERIILVLLNSHEEIEKESEAMDSINKVRESLIGITRDIIPLLTTEPLSVTRFLLAQECQILPILLKPSANPVYLNIMSDTFNIFLDKIISVAEEEENKQKLEVILLVGVQIGLNVEINVKYKNILLNLLNLYVKPKNGIILLTQSQKILEGNRILAEKEFWFVAFEFLIEWMYTTISEETMMKNPDTELINQFLAIERLIFTIYIKRSELLQNSNIMQMLLGIILSLMVEGIPPNIHKENINFLNVLLRANPGVFKNLLQSITTNEVKYLQNILTNPVSASVKS